MSDTPSQQLLAAFSARWEERGGAEPSEFLPAPDSPERPQVLVQLLCTDIRLRWQRGLERTLEEYAANFPELGPMQALPLELILADCKMRQLKGRPASLAELERRFPARDLRDHPTLLSFLDDPLDSLATIGTPSSAPLDAGIAPIGLPSSPLPVLPSRYDEQGLIARGGMGDVIIAFDRVLEREVAMKTLRDDRRALTGPTRRRFLREARIHGRLEHPGIAPLYDLGADDLGMPFFTMKLVRGRSLAQTLRQLYDDIGQGRGDQRFPLAQRLDVFRKVCDAVGYAHANGIIHRDIKPANVMVGAFGEVQVMDWGLARSIARRSGSTPAPEDTAPGDDEDAAQGPAGFTQEVIDAAFDQGAAASTPGSISDTPTLAGSILGTPPYMAPEQAEGKIDQLDERADIYSLGALLYSLLTLHSPFQGRSTATMLARVIAGEFDRPTERVAADRVLHEAGHVVAGELEAVIMRAMHRDPLQRYASALELRTDIDLFLDGRMVTASRYTLGQRLSKWARRHRGKLLSAALVLVVAVAGLVASGAAARRAREGQIARDLSAVDGHLRAAEHDLAVIRTQVEAGAFEEALQLAQRHGEQHATGLELVLQSRAAGEHRPQWVARATDIPGAVAEQRAAALGAWLQGVRAGLTAEGLADVADARCAEVDAIFGRMEPFREAASAAGVEIAELPLWLAMVAAARADRLHGELAALELPQPKREAEMRRREAEVVLQVARAWQCQPRSQAGAAGFLLLAERALAGVSDQENARDVAMRFHLAHSLFTADFPTLAPRLLVGLAESLLVLRPGTATPFAPEVPAEEMAMRCLLRLVSPAGEPQPTLAVLPAREQAPLLLRTRDLLSVGRRILYRTAIPGWTADPVDPECFFRLQDGALELARAVVEDEGTVSLTVHLTVDLGAEASARGLPGSVRRAWLMPHRPGGLRAVAIVEEEKGADAGHLLLLDDGGAASTTWQVRQVLQKQLLPAAATQGDVDGDGDADLVLACRRRFDHPENALLQLHMQSAGGAFAEEALYPDDERFLGLGPNRGHIGELQCCDLDGDGPEEVLVGRREWSDLSIAVFGLGEDKIVLRLDDVRVGQPSLWVAATPEGPRILTSSWVRWDLRFNWTVQGQHVPTRPRMFRWTKGESGRELIEQEWPWQLANDLVSWAWGSNGIVDLDGGKRALVERCNRWMAGQNEGGPLFRWHFFTGELPRPSDTRTMLIGSSLGPAGPRLYCSAPPLDEPFLSRTATDAELVTRAVAPIPAESGPSARGEPSDVLLARVLLAFGHPEGAAAAIARGDHGAGDATVREALMQLEVRALHEAGDGEALLRIAATLPPADADVSILLAAADAILDLNARFEDMLPILERWQKDAHVSRAQRILIEERTTPWRSAIALLESTKNTLHGHHVERVEAGEREHGSLADYWVCNDPLVILPEPEGAWHARTWGRLMTLSGEPGSGLVSLGRNLTDGGAPPVSTHQDRIAGVPVRITPGAARISIELTTAGCAWATPAELLLIPLSIPAGDPSGAPAHWRPGRDEPGAGEPALVFGFGSGGGANVFAVRTRGDLNCLLDASLDHRLRMDYEVLHRLGIERLTLTDLDSGRLLAALHRPWSARTSWPYFLLGIRASHSSSSQFSQELTIHRIELAGTIDLLRTDDPELRTLLPSSRTQELVTRAVQAGMRGERDTAAAELRQLAGEMRAAAPGGDPEAAAGLELGAQRLLIEAAWQQTGADARALAALLAQPPLRDEINVPVLLDWALCRPQLPEAAREPWRAVGLHLAGGAPLDLAAIQARLADENRSDPQYSLETAALATLLGEDPHPLSREQRLLEATAVAIAIGENGEFEHVYWLMRLLSGIDDPATMPAELRLPYATGLHNLLRRRELIAVAHPEDAPILWPPRPHCLDLAIRLDQFRRDEQEEEAARLRRRGYALPR